MLTLQERKHKKSDEIFVQRTEILTTKSNKCESEIFF